MKRQGSYTDDEMKAVQFFIKSGGKPGMINVENKKNSILEVIKSEGKDPSGEMFKILKGGGTK